MTQGILSGPAIEDAIRSGRIHIDPYNPSRINPASYDLTLGKNVAVYLAVVDINNRIGIEDGRYFEPSDESTLNFMKGKPVAKSFEIDPKLGWVLKPGIGYIMHCEEKVHTDCYVPVIDGKSSLGRLFIQVHVTAGYVDPGFDGQYTLEVVVTHPVRVFPGMPFCQVRFHEISGEIRLYDGHYKGLTATGAVSAEISGLKQF